MEINRISGINITNRTNTATGTNFGAMPTDATFKLLGRMRKAGVDINPLMASMKKAYTNMAADTYYTGVKPDECMFAILQDGLRCPYNGFKIKFSDTPDLNLNNLARKISESLKDWANRRSLSQQRIDREFAELRVDDIKKEFQAI